MPNSLVIFKMQVQIVRNQSQLPPFLVDKLATKAFGCEENKHSHRLFFFK